MQESQSNGGPSREAQIETEKSLEWLHRTETSMQEDLHRIKNKLDSIAEALGELEDTVEELQEYSYAFNVKILGVPELNQQESAEETLRLCIKLFHKMGAHITIDINIAHRVPTRNHTTARMGPTKPKPIVCKFVRRLARSEKRSRQCLRS